jgi:hypothetical protein
LLVDIKARNSSRHEPSGIMHELRLKKMDAAGIRFMLEKQQFM